ncbi:(d)CMP kinase [Paraconexibacter antarcticus]|uniref:(d)CMP kinase n=1 Tax=Paraconexibacter antarcticus TaxID=2949664 RepID=A0ABY5DMT3_9ACTN|nr:(d)CMP kinase [Paraconexibacter antarcticus]UTI63323.1 (d)CMP kinase [Paraconexibacter antarcticus]
MVTIDGASGSGKSGAIGALSCAYGALPIEFGPLMRTVAYIARERRFTALDAAALLAALERRGCVELAGESSSGLAASELTVDGTPYRQIIFAANIQEALATASSTPAIVDLLAAMTRSRITGRRTLLSGRQAGTILCPEAGLKILLTARSDVRRIRKMTQLRQAGLRPKWADDVRLLANDSRFDLSIDTTFLSQQAVALAISRIVEYRLGWTRASVYLEPSHRPDRAASPDLLLR